MSRSYTKEEMREMFLDYTRAMAWYWANVGKQTELEKIEGALFSLLNAFDGTAGGFPCAIDLVLRPHPDNKAFHQSVGDNWVEDGMCINDDVMLHELFFKHGDL